MLEIYQSLAHIALDEFSDLVTATVFAGGTAASPNKLRLHLQDGSFLDLWISEDGDYAYHLEQRRQRGFIHRWDNAPHHPRVETFPDHFHSVDENTILASQLNSVPAEALRQVLEFVRQNLT